MSLVIYTDGSCLKNPGGPGGWAFAMVLDGTEWRVSGCDNSTTNNRMELTAVIEALKFGSRRGKATIYTDSQWVIKCASGVWNRKANMDLWEDYNEISVKYKDISWVWVKGHSGDVMNEVVDKLARYEAEYWTRKLYSPVKVPRGKLGKKNLGK